MTRTYTDTKKANAGAPIAWAGGVFEGPLTSKLAEWPFKESAPFATRKTSICLRPRPEI